MKHDFAVERSIGVNNNNKKKMLIKERVISKKKGIFFRVFGLWNFIQYIGKIEFSQLLQYLDDLDYNSLYLSKSIKSLLNVSGLFLLFILLCSYVKILSLVEKRNIIYSKYASLQKQMTLIALLFIFYFFLYSLDQLFEQGYI